jgi:hypothetical protein
MAAAPPPLTLDTPAPDFRLPGTDARTYTFDDIAGENGTVIVFICNHCPYVKAVIDRLVADAGALQRFAQTHAFPFPYLHDEHQSVARAYGAVCTPDFFGYNALRRLKYRGRLDEGRTSPPPLGARRELLEAMRAIAVNGEAPPGQAPSIGCSIKWKVDA